MRVTIACPDGLIGDANQLALCLGLGPEDARTYGEAVWLDAAGNRYAVASAIVSSRFAADASSPMMQASRSGPAGAPIWIKACARAAAVISAPHCGSASGDDVSAANRLDTMAEATA